MDLKLPELDEYGSETANFEKIYQFSIKHPDLFWGKIAKARLQWFKEFDEVCNTDSLKSFADENFRIKWFSGGKLNLTVNCVDRHYRANPDQLALIWERDEPGTQEYFTYKQLYETMNQIANMLKAHGIKRGDCVAFYSQASFYAVASTLACARIGAIYTCVYAGFSAQALAYRLNEAECVALITDNESLRGTKHSGIKTVADEAVKESPTVKLTFVINRTNATYEQNDQVIDLCQELESYSKECEPEQMDSEDILFITFTSGTTGNPKALVHTQAGFFLVNSFLGTATERPKETIIFFIGDFAWIAFSAGIYGTLASGCCSVLFDSSYLYPNPGRIWEMVERLQITSLSLYPNIIKDLMKYSDEWPKKYDISKLKTISLGAEPVDEKTWRWLYEVATQERIMIFDAWGSTEFGGAGFFSLLFGGESGEGLQTVSIPLMGIRTVLLDDEGNELPSENSNGHLCLSSIYPGMARTIKNNHEKFLEAYLRPFPGYFYTGDFASFDENGSLRVHGRGDEVLKLSHKLVAESAAVGIPNDDIYGIIPFVFLVLKSNEHIDEDSMKNELKALIETRIVPPDLPIQYLVVNGLPKTRTGKILRRVLRKIAERQYDCLGDLSALENPSCLEHIIKAHQNKYLV